MHYWWILVATNMYNMGQIWFYNPPEKLDDLAKAKKSSTFAAKSSRLWEDTVNLMPRLRKSGNRCPSRERVIKLISDQVWNRCPLRKRVIKLISDQVWSTDISYVPLEHGFMYLYAMIDVYSRYVLGWRLSNTLSARKCYELLQECIEQPCKDVSKGCVNRKKMFV